MECLMDDNDDSIDEKVYEEPNVLSRSISGTFQALPAQVIEQSTSLPNEVHNVSVPPQESLDLPPVDKLTKERREFCNSMLTENVSSNENVIDQVKRNKVDLMAEIRNQVQETPAVDEVFQFGRANTVSPVILKDINIESNDVSKQQCQRHNRGLENGLCHLYLPLIVPH